MGLKSWFKPKSPTKMSNFGDITNVIMWVFLAIIAVTAGLWGYNKVRNLAGTGGVSTVYDKISKIGG